MLCQVSDIIFKHVVVFYVLIVIFLNNTDCTPVKFWFLARHGTRLTSAGGIREMRALTEVR